jgi:hypothetical protein
LPLAQLGGWGQAAGDAGVASCAAGRLCDLPELPCCLLRSRKVGGELPELPIDSGKLGDTPVDRKDGLRGRQISIWVSDKSGGYFV